jgi:hypothetical protein
MNTFDIANDHFVTDFLAVGGDLAYDNDKEIRGVDKSTRLHLN